MRRVPKCARLLGCVENLQNLVPFPWAATATTNHFLFSDKIYRSLRRCRGCSRFLRNANSCRREKGRWGTSPLESPCIAKKQYHRILFLRESKMWETIRHAPHCGHIFLRCQSYKDIPGTLVPSRPYRDTRSIRIYKRYIYISHV